jgi:NAD(P)-dependent dehydrogenase (short-subunit alcohol dehydrogenase family)
MPVNKFSKIAVVTGAAHRLGGYIALSLAQQGYAILLHYYSSDRQANKMVESIKSMGVEVYTFKADLTDCEQIKKMWEFIDSLPHQIEILINSAAVMYQEDIRTLSASVFDETIALNLRAPLMCSQEAAKRMALGGLIVNISDIGAGKNWLGYPAYSISKAALEVLTRLLAKALAPDIRVNAIAPGLVIPPEKGDVRVWEKLVEKVPLKRTASLSEITSMVDYLISNKYITGQVLEIDGGYSLL